MSRFLVLDIETVANDHAKTYWAKKEYDAPGNYKDKEKIAAYIAEKRFNDQQKSGLYWWTGKIICVSMRLPGARPVRIQGDDEARLLTQVFEHLERTTATTIIGKSADTFDKPFIVGRAIANDLGVPLLLRPYRPIEDIDQIFGFTSQSNQRSSLSDYAFGLRIDGKLGHGSMVQDWYNRITLGEIGLWDEIGKYCDKDVDIVCEMLRRWEKPFGIPEVSHTAVEIPFGPTTADVQGA